MANCVTVTIFRRKTPFLLWRQLPFKTFTGLKADNTKAGYKPASKRVIKDMAPMNKITSIQWTTSLLADNALKKGRPRNISPRADMHAIAINKKDSNRNCHIN